MGGGCRESNQGPQGEKEVSIQKTLTVIAQGVELLIISAKFDSINQKVKEREIGFLWARI